MSRARAVKRAEAWARALERRAVDEEKHFRVRWTPLGGEYFATLQEAEAYRDKVLADKAVEFPPRDRREAHRWFSSETTVHRLRLLIERRQDQAWHLVDGSERECVTGYEIGEGKT
ncbi:MAG: hypothetical protein ACRENE_12305 [Polyangiaceae bacterium]